MRLTLAQIVAAMQATLPAGAEPSRVPVAVSTDSRTVPAGALFFCIKGDRFDGHEFLAEVAAKGALAAVVEQDIPAPPLPCLRVEATVPALGLLALAHRRTFSGPVVGITGTAGKTTLKELLAHLLEGLGPVARNHKNFNNHIGLPGAMLAATGEEAFWVLETGVNFVGDMDPLAAMLEPDLVVALNAGAGHLEGLHDVATVAAEKCKLVRALRPGGVVVANADCAPLAAAVRQVVLETGCKVVWFSASKATEADSRCEFLGADTKDGQYRLQLRGEALDVRTPFAAPFLAQTVAAAAAVAHRLGARPAQIAERLATARLPEQRFQVQRLGRFLVIDDSYNANPVSMAAVLEAGRTLAGAGRLVLVLGEMRELGAAAEVAHRELGLQAARLEPAAIFWIGGQGQALAAGMAEAGSGVPLHSLSTPEQFVQDLQPISESVGNAAEDVVVLFKGSRANRLERFVTALRDTAEGAC